MAQKNRKVVPYWDNRAVSQEQKLHDQLPVLEKKVFNAYEKAQRYLTGQATAIYDRYINRSGRTKEDVEKILNTSVPAKELVELQRLAQTIEDPGIKKQVRSYLDGLAAKHRITRLEDLKAKSYIVSKQIADVQQIEQTDFYIDAIQEAYDQAATESIIGKTEEAIRDGFEIQDWKTGETVRLPREVDIGPVFKENNDYSKVEIVDWNTQKVVHIINLEKDSPVKFKELSTHETKNILASEWKGDNYSERIWNDTEKLAKRVEELFTVEAMTGMSELEMARELQSEFRVASNIAKRLIRTEANYMANQAKLKGWKNHGVERYVIVAVLDLRTSQRCRDEDGEIYEVVKAVVSLNFPPFHPWCRTVVRAYFGKHTLSGTRTANDPITGETFTINMSDNYKKWEQKLQEKHGKEKVEINRKELLNFNRDEEQYNRYKKLIGEENMPDSVEDFQRIKYNNDRHWQLTKLDYRRRKALIDRPELKLPNADRATIDDNKFSGYLFNEDSEKGYAKGRLFESRLGYNATNFDGLKQTIIDNLSNYPSSYKGDNQYGSRYEVNMILYNKNKVPTNVKTAWLVSGEKTHLTTALIEEA